MASHNFYDILDGVVPGGVYPHLDTTAVLERKIYLSRMSMDGLDDMHEYSSDERLYEYFEFKPFKKKEETKHYLQKLIDRSDIRKGDVKFMYWFVRLVENHKVIGSIGLVDIDVGRDSASWGYAISPSYWGQGCILEAQLLVVKYFFEDLKMNRLWGVTDVDNQRTISSVFSAGFIKEGVLREFYKYADGHRQDALAYSLLARDYFASKEDKKDHGLKSFFTFEKIRDVMSSVFEMSTDDIQQDTNMANVQKWDSFNHIALISRIEKDAKIKFKPFEIAKATSVQALLEIINSRS